jgi:hypothetical protein
MVIDTSARVAILQRETGPAISLRQSWPREGSEGLRDPDRFISRAGIELIPVNAEP